MEELEPIDPDIILAAEDDNLVSKRRKIERQLLTLGLSQKEVAERMWNDPTMRELIPSTTLAAWYNLVKQDAFKMVRDMKLEDVGRTDHARWQYLNRQEAIFRKAWRDANDDSHSEYFRVQSLKLASESSKNAAKVQGVDVERPVKIQLNEEWEVYIDNWGNAQRKPVAEPGSVEYLPPPDEEEPS